MLKRSIYSEGVKGKGLSRNESMRFDEITEISLLYDFYGQLLTRRQREAMRLYYEENLSLSEIAGEFSISRQGVHDSLRNGEKALKEYEKKLGLLERFRKSREAVRHIDSALDWIMERLEADDTDGRLKETAEEIRKVKDIIDRLED